MRVRVEGLWSFEELLEWLGSLGKWQCWIYGWIAFAQFFLGAINVVVVFFQITPPHVCIPPHVPFHKFTDQQLLNISGVKEQDRCNIRDRDYGLFEGEGFRWDNATHNDSSYPTIPCNRWRFNTSGHTMHRTIVTQWKLVCNDGWYVATAQSVYMAGFLVGVFVAGALSDRFGRKKIMVLSGMAVGGLGIIQARVSNYFVFLVFRFVLSVASNMCSISSFVLALEVTTSRLRVWIGGLFFIPYSLGYTALAGFAYGLRDWRDLHVALSVPLFVLLGYWWLIPESPRWLMSVGRVAEAEEVLNHASWINKAVSKVPTSLEKMADSMKSTPSLLVDYFAMWKHKKLALRSFNLYFNWFVNALVYYGVSLNVSSFLKGNVFMTNGVAGAVEIPGYLICVPLLYWGRRKSLVLTLFLVALPLIIVPWMSSYWFRLLLVMLGKLCITASFNLAYVITLEVHPTIVRSNGMSMSSMVGRFGSISAPFVSQISEQNPDLYWVPMMIFGVAALIASFLSFFLPETKGKILPEKVSQALALTWNATDSMTISNMHEDESTEPHDPNKPKETSF